MLTKIISENPLYIAIVTRRNIFAGRSSKAQSTYQNVLLRSLHCCYKYTMTVTVATKMRGQAP